MNPNNDIFEVEDYEGTPLLQAIYQLAEETDRTIAEFETLTMGQIVDLAKLQYPHDLPEIWQIWIDWNDGDSVQPMGDL